jgi:hypothetical protein
MKLLSIKLKIVILIIGLIIISIGDVYGADWKPYYSNENFLAYYDVQSITRSSKNIVRVWVRSIYTENGVIDWVGSVGKEYENLSYSIDLWEINCIEKRNRLLSWTAYDNKGNVIAFSQFSIRMGFYRSRIEYRDFI